ncbi:MAG TPA: L-aspartate oxidase [Syntrophorhabdaceae bacterium]|nr:L-aspartate oxidase [Syntrophorhabdaceae bacterium]HOL05199.1 L-aspartate oxidase [Syntrophorhabdaceae bacterium]HON86483.1 L-aspartate oxidase [Syntrophorhabdaceae bacterium]HOT42934.1 L-aspartate oxidase [Syntrophorhabdaceae bacterium]HPC66305.1 L-aspartate oxidase [Syntrophorhabdaceae bacterium]
MKDKKHYCDVLIIGSGIAGLSTAINLCESGLNVILITKAKNIEESNTLYAQGGIVTLGKDDSPRLLAQDIIDAGDGISNPLAVELVTKEGTKLVEDFLIKKVSVQFSKSSEKAYDYAQEGSHSRRRVLYWRDETGKAIEVGLSKRVKEYKNIRIFTDYSAIDLLTIPHHSVNPITIYREPQCIGAYVLNNVEERVERIFAQYTVLASGGLGRIYLHTTNPPGATGDGFAMARRAGARIINMEYVQFHPTSLFHKDADGFLISEAVRGEGARLKTKSGETFMEKYSPLKDLAPRDEVSRAIYEEMHQRGDNYVYLDISNYSEVDIKERFPNIYSRCLSLGIDITKEPIPVVPAAHYICGGVQVDTWGRSSIKNLYAVGEVSGTGLHGANRLASTSLLEGLVWGIRAARHIADNFEDDKPYKESEILPWIYPEMEEEADPALILQDWLSIKSIMWNYVGIIRTLKRLERGVADLSYLKNRIEDFYKKAHLTPTIVSLRNGIQTALIVAEFALRNRKSRGAHFIKSTT